MSLSISLLMPVAAAVTRVFRRGGFIAIGNQTLASQEASYNFTAARRAKITASYEDVSRAKINHPRLKRAGEESCGQKGQLLSPRVPAACASYHHAEPDLSIRADISLLLGWSNRR
jgi:hypothetical protein